MSQPQRDTRSGEFSKQIDQSESLLVHVTVDWNHSSFHATLSSITERNSTPPMNTTPLEPVTTLTFDIFGTVLDLAGSLIPPLADLLRNCHADMDGTTPGTITSS